MSIQKLRTIARRGSLFGAVFAIVAATFASAVPTYADALNPLTDRSLTLSSSSPGWDFKDGSGNSTYAPPNSGANGQKTGNTFAFKVSTDTSGGTMKAMTFQYCTKSAGQCISPGDITSGSNEENIANKKSNLEIKATTPSELAELSFGTYVNSTTGEVKAIPAATSTGSNFVVYSQTAGADTVTTSDDVWSYSAGWTMSAEVAQDGTANLMPNQITLKNAGTGFAAKTPVKVVFFATDNNYITNPGSGAFFVKINTYNDPTLRADANIIDGGVTVANVMNQSISIQTKVLETMDFSVGTVDPNTLSTAQLVAATADEENALTEHQVCGRILKGMTSSDAVNTLKLGDQTSEFSLQTDHTYSSHSYWRLSSNSSAGATVYYSGNTLSNTVNDKIKAIGATKKVPAPGGEQFGIALANVNDSTTPPAADGNGVLRGYNVDYSTEEQNGKLYEYGADDAAAGLAALRADTDGSDGATGISSDMLASDASSNGSYHAPQLYPLKAADNYDSGAGNVNSGYGPVNTAFAFDETSQQIPVPLATEDAQVVDCVTGKMRYVANIAATTPAGIYTTKINYIAAPQY